MANIECEYECPHCKTEWVIGDDGIYTGDHPMTGQYVRPEARTAWAAWQAAIEIIPRLLDIGYKIRKQDGEWWMFENDGEGVAGGKTFREMCERLAGVDVKEHERRHLERCRWYMENRDRLLGRR